MLPHRPLEGPRHRVLVVGTGSIGRRHILNLSCLGAEVSAFSYRGRGSIDGAEHVRVFDRLEEALHASPDAVVVANRTDQHMSVALAAADSGRHLFIEKPLSHALRDVDRFTKIADARRLVIETGFMLRFHPNLTWMKTFVERGGVGHVHYVRALFGQYLPDWRPGTDYRECYSAHPNGGGVIFDVTHELDLLRWLFGPIVAVTAMVGFSASLQIESEAIAQIGLRFNNGVLGQLHLDYVRPVYARRLEVVGTTGIATWDYTSGTVSLTERPGTTRVVHRVPDGFKRNHMFVAYMRYFLQRLSDPTLPAASSLKDGIAAMRAALACHQSARDRRCVDPLLVHPG